jgi:hypothetical protein
MSSVKEGRHSSTKAATGGAESFEKKMRNIQARTARSAEPRYNGEKTPKAMTASNFFSGEGDDFTAEVMQSLHANSLSNETAPFGVTSGGLGAGLNQGSIDSSLAFDNQHDGSGTGGDAYHQKMQELNSLDGSGSGVYLQESMSSQTLLNDGGGSSLFSPDGATKAVRPRANTGNFTMGSSLESMPSMVTADQSDQQFTLPQMTMTPIKSSRGAASAGGSGTMRPNTTGGMSSSGGRKNSTFMVASKLDKLANEAPQERPVHSMDARQLTDMYFQLTKAERELEDAEAARAAGIVVDAGATKAGDGDDKDKDAKPMKWMEMRIDLNEFKRMNGYTGGDVHEEIFHKPNPLQLALLVVPEERKNKEIRIIMEELVNMELFRGVKNEELLRHVAENIEYRSVLKGDFIFQQGENVECCCILLTGKVQLKAESTNGAVWNIGSLREGENFGDQWVLMSKYGTSRKSISHQSYLAEAPCQLLVMDMDLLEGDVLDICMGKIRKKVEALENTTLFSQWGPAELFDLACLASTRNYVKGVELVEQGAPFEYLGILTMGLCGCTKFADRAAQICRNIADLEKQLKRLQISYKFHHTLRDRAVTKRDQNGYYDIEMDPKPFETVTEREKDEIQEQIEMWSSRLRKLEREGGDSKDRRLRVGSLVSGGIFGETCVLEPFESLAIGGIESDTNCEAILIHKSVLQRYDYTGTDEFTELVGKKAPLYPEDSRLVDQLKQCEDWQDYRHSVMKEVKKTRWPVDRRRIRKVTGGTIITHDLETKFTAKNINSN